MRGKELLRLRPKYYVVDMAFKQLLLPDSNRDRGHVLENIVYLELRRRGYTVYVGQLTKGEIRLCCSKAWWHIRVLPSIRKCIGSNY